MIEATTRRAVVAATAALACCLFLAGAATAAEPLTIARLRYAGGDWYCDPSALPNWLALFRERTGIETADEPVVVTMDSEDLYRYPLLYLSGHGDIRLSDHEIRELRRYLDAGGFLYVDDNYGLDAAVRRLVEALYPGESLRPVGSEHPIYSCWYALPGLPKIHEHDGDPAQGFGLEHAGRLVVFYSWSSDIADGLEDPQVHGDPSAAREAAAQMAVNILMYALTHP